MGDLLKIYLNIIPTNQCNIRYFLNNRNQLEFGIKSDSMMCAAPANGKQDTCGVRYILNFDMIYYIRILHIVKM